MKQATNKEQAMKVGDRVETTQVADRYPHFCLAAGAVGTVTDIDTEGNAWVKMDETVAGAEEWDNEVAFGPMYDGATASDVLMPA